MSAMDTTVLVVGAGPIGSLIALQLQRFGVDCLIVEADNKSSAPIYGRACTLCAAHALVWPDDVQLAPLARDLRADASPLVPLSVQDQLDALEDLLQQGVVTRNGLHFADGERAAGGFQYGHNMRNLPTQCNFSLHLRQRRIEQSFANALADGTILEQHSLQSLTSDDSGVSCVVRNIKTGEDVTIRARYLIGADGGRSTVRKLAGIDWIGDRTANKWIRMDGARAAQPLF